ncbi:hypothetical protein AH04_51 [Erwinia phage AH04]|uniref:Uncharacterized protein n=1 Tax=Erwinia phage AH04 TaxID=2869569 RepID=A0AAE7X0G0_9CAUD|nr:hypothetical protein PQC02_gp263 [Erwinia phage AH04]QZA70535.1 hypothetical protein AH04_51 [Erwinia phage AH04]
MRLKDLVNEILIDAALKNPPKPYRNVYFIKVLNPGDRKSLFVSFRYKSSKNEVFICFVEIDLNNTERNVSYGISFLIPRARESTTFFKKSEFIPYKDIIEILKMKVIPTFVEKLQKVESLYEQD